MKKKYFAKQGIGRQKKSVHSYTKDCERIDETHTCVISQITRLVFKNNIG